MATQNAQMPHKVEVVDEVKTRLSASDGVDRQRVPRPDRGRAGRSPSRACPPSAGDYKIFKNTLVRRAIDGGEYQPLSEYLSGPSALTFVQGDISAVAKALRDFARANPHLVIKGGLADGSLLSTSDLAALADLPPREVLLARFAGALAAPLQNMAGLLKAMPQNLAYGISALIEEKGGVDEAAAPEAPRRTRAEAAAPERRPPRHRTRGRRPEAAPEEAAAEPTEAAEPRPSGR